MVKKLEGQLDYAGSPVTPADWLSSIKPGAELDPKYIDIGLANARETAENVQDTPFGSAYEYNVPGDESFWQITVLHPDFGVMSLGLGGEVYSANITAPSPPENSGIDGRVWRNSVRKHLRNVCSYLRDSENTPPELRQAIVTREPNYTSLLQEI